MPASSTTIVAKLVSCGSTNDVVVCDSNNVHRQAHSGAVVRAVATPTDANSIASSSATSSSLKSCLKNSDCLKAPERRKVTFDPEFKSSRSPAVQRRYDRRKHGKDGDEEEESSSISSKSSSRRRSSRSEAYGHTNTVDDVARADIQRYQSALACMESSLTNNNKHHNSLPDGGNEIRRGEEKMDPYDSSSSARIVNAGANTNARCKRDSPVSSTTTHKIVQTSRNIETAEDGRGDKGAWRSRVWAKYAVTPAPPDEEFPPFSPLSGQFYADIEPNEDIALLNVVNLVSPDVDSSSSRSGKVSPFEGLKEKEWESPSVSYEGDKPTNETNAKLHRNKDDSSSFYISSDDDDSWKSEMSREQLENALSPDKPFAQHVISQIVAASGGCAENLMNNISCETVSEKRTEECDDGIIAVPKQNTVVSTQVFDDKSASHPNSLICKSTSPPQRQITSTNTLLPSDGNDAVDVASPLPDAIPLQRGMPSSSSSQVSELTNDFSWISKNESNRMHPSKAFKVNDALTVTGENPVYDFERGDGMHWSAEEFDDVFVVTEREREDNQMSKKRRRYRRLGIIFLLVVLSCIVVGVVVFGGDNPPKSGDISSQVSAPSILSMSSIPSVAPSNSPASSSSSGTASSLPTSTTGTRLPTTSTGSTNPTSSPVTSPTQQPVFPTKQPSNYPVNIPTRFPSPDPTSSPTKVPTEYPSLAPTYSPSSAFPTSVPTPLPWQDDMLLQLNDERSKVGVPPLCFNEKLIASAEVHALDMAENDFVGLNGSDGSSSTERVRVQGYDRRWIGEVVVRGYDSVSEIMEYFFEPGSQRSEIAVSSKYVHFGVGKVEDYWSAVFASSTDANESCMM
eukprot:CAMPEP_0196806544 /NCGR_PEP_ID=MMETSP1362-20130617/6433_1 /TAXON_ID=163516 /ORGANISM="Leptocylindrus danicus, Strain CCMP1856" /LENGTH=851 /DNA_ID=CAMNT_0042180053 /DNA_START=54 /DNA_END=2609 /DNA_ORIENTATION=+